MLANNIRHLADVDDGLRCHDRSRDDPHQGAGRPSPLSGWAGAEDGPAEAFVGWLQLLEILNRVVLALASAGPASGSRGQFNAGAQSELGQDV